MRTSALLHIHINHQRFYEKHRCMFYNCNAGLQFILRNLKGSEGDHIWPHGCQGANASKLQKPKLKTWGLSCRSCPKTRSSQHSTLSSTTSNHVTYWALHSPSHPIEALQKAGLCMRWRQHWSLKSEKLQSPNYNIVWSQIRDDRSSQVQEAQKIWLQTLGDQSIQPQKLQSIQQIACQPAAG